MHVLVVFLVASWTFGRTTTSEKGEKTTTLLLLRGGGSGVLLRVYRSVCRLGFTSCPVA